MNTDTEKSEALMAQSTRMSFPRSSGYRIAEQITAGRSRWEVWHHQDGYAEAFESLDEAADWIHNAEITMREIREAIGKPPAVGSPEWIKEINS